MFLDNGVSFFFFFFYILIREKSILKTCLNIVSIMSYSVKASAVYWYEGLNGTKERELQPASVRKKKRKKKTMNTRYHCLHCKDLEVWFSLSGNNYASWWPYLVGVIQWTAEFCSLMILHHQITVSFQQFVFTIIWM